MSQIIIFILESLWYIEIRHYRLIVEFVLLDLSYDFGYVIDSFGQIGEHRSHLLFALEILLFGISDPGRIVNIFAGIQTDKPIMRLRIPGTGEVDIVGGYYLDIEFCRELFNPLNSCLLFRENLPVAVRFISLVPLYLQIKIVAKNVQITFKSLFGRQHVAVYQFPLYLPGDTCR